MRVQPVLQLGPQSTASASASSSDHSITIAMADPTDLNLDAPSDLQDIPDLPMQQLVPPPEGTYPDKLSCPTCHPLTHTCSGTTPLHYLCESILM